MPRRASRRSRSGLSRRAKRRISASMSSSVLALGRARGSRSRPAPPRDSRRRGGCGRGRRRRRSPRAVPAAVGRLAAQAAGLDARARSGRCQRLAGRNQASNSSSKRRHSSRRPHSSACRLQRSTLASSTPTRSRGPQHLRPRRRRRRRSRWRAGSPGSRSAAARRAHRSAGVGRISMPPPVAPPPRAGMPRGRRAS